MPDVNTHQVEVEELMTECTCCDEVVVQSETEITTDGNEVCVDCREEEHVYCYNCDDLIHNNDSSYSDNDGEYYCESCYYDRYGSCDSCGEETYNDEQVEQPNGDWYCNDCNDSSSGNYVFEVQTDVSQLGCAVSSEVFCNVNDDNGYSDTMTLARYDNPESFDIIKSKRWIGVELECVIRTTYEDLENAIYKDLIAMSSGEIKNAYNEANMSPRIGFEAVVSDGSVSSNSSDSDAYGGEVVMRPRRGDYFIQDVKTVSRTIKRYADGYVNYSCGTHVHVDSRDLDWNHRLILTGFVKLVEPHLYSFLAPSRRTNHYCKPVSQHWNMFQDVYDRDTFIDFWYDTDSFYNGRWNDKRYYGLNQHPSFWDGGTKSIELRYHSGTLSPEKLKHWAILWTSIIDKTKEITDSVSEKNSGENIFKSIFPFANNTGSYKLSKELYNMYDIQSTERSSNDERHYVRITKDKPTNDEIVTRLVSEFNLSGTQVAMLYSEIFENNGLAERVKYERYRSFIGSMLDLTDNPYIDINNLFDLLDTPSDTRQHFRERLHTTLSSSDTPEAHYERCFENAMGVVRFDEDKMCFDIVDDEIEKMEFKYNSFRRSTDFSYNHLEYSLLRNDTPDNSTDMPHNRYVKIVEHTTEDESEANTYDEIQSIYAIHEEL